MTARKNPSLIVAGLCVAGLVTGFAARRLSPAPPVVAVADDNVSGNDRARPKSPRAAAAAPAVPDIASFPERHTTETAESLERFPDDQLYAPLAQWLIDATEPEIADYWKNYSQKKGRSNDITDLIFLNWTRLDPRAAIAGSSSDQHAWWAWASHDPDAALAEARANAPDHINHVTWGIGEFHPDWLRAHYNELSQGAKDNALQGLAKWDDPEDPLAAIKFLKEIGRSVTPGTFKALVRQDPWAALDWVKENGADRESFGYRIDDPMKLIVDTMAQDRPEDLARLAAQTPSGALKLQMESALFTNLLETDPDAAMEQAKSTTVPRTAAERYAAIGNTLVKTDPEQAFAIAADLFAACPNPLYMPQMVEYPGGSSGSSSEIPGVEEFMNSLVASDPVRALELSIGLEPGKYGESSFSRLSSQWAQRDLPAYARWVNQQSDEKLRGQGANIVINQLQQDQNFTEAAEWVLSTRKENEDWKIMNLLSNWNRNEPQAAAEWLENLEFPADRKERLRASLNR